MRKAPEDFYNLFCEAFLERACVPLSFVNWTRFLLVLYGVAGDMTGRCYEAAEPTVAELLEEWSDFFTCRLFERLSDEINGSKRLNFPVLPPIDNANILREYCELSGKNYSFEEMNHEKISD